VWYGTSCADGYNQRSLFPCQWSVSQHPNFFGNLLIWIGILIINAPSLIEPTSVVVKSPSSIFMQLWSFRRFGLALLSPLFMWTLFYGQASGSITNSVALANLKYGDDPNYKKYVASVPLIIPRFYWYKR
jgi:steroid 5-alpha reductase family enzyme